MTLPNLSKLEAVHFPCVRFLISKRFEGAGLGEAPNLPLLGLTTDELSLHDEVFDDLLRLRCIVCCGTEPLRSAQLEGLVALDLEYDLVETSLLETGNVERASYVRNDADARVGVHPPLHLQTFRSGGYALLKLLYYWLHAKFFQCFRIGPVMLSQYRDR